MSAEQLITDHLDLWTSAVTCKSGRGASNNRELTGIKKLRELILELAVRGKLVEQDPNDEPASVLLERIAEEKARLIKERKIKKPKILPEVTKEEKSFELPNGWHWTRSGEAYDVRDGTHDTPKYHPKGYPLITSKNISSGYLSFEDVNYISETDHLKIQERSRADRDDLLFAMIGSIGNPVIVRTKKEFSVKNVAIFKYFDNKLSSPKFLKVLLEQATSKLREQSSGGVQAFVSLGKLRGWPIALPPLEEQHRIVAKVDELMALCDRLEQQTGDQLDAHEVLVDTRLEALTRAENIDEVAAQWTRLAEHFDTLFTTEASIDKLKQAILQLAVMGRLVEQDPDDEPASVLLEKIAEQKARLVEEGMIKKPKRFPHIVDNERSYQIHKNWVWVRFQDIANEISTGPFGSMIHKHDYVHNGVPLINPSHMVNGSIQEDLSVSIPPQKAEELSSYKLNESDIVMARRGEVGRCAIVSEREADWLCGTGSFVLRSWIHRINAALWIIR